MEANAGTCYLQDLPVHLLYRVTQLLDLHSQRNLFLCSPQLYSKWHLQIAIDDLLWQFTRSCIDLVLANLSSGVCNSASLCLVPEDFQHSPAVNKPLDRMLDAAFKFKPSGRSSTLMVTHSRVPPLQSTWTEMTKDQFWHRLVGVPEPRVDALFGISSADGAGYDDLNALGQQLFKTLCSSNGNLHFNVSPRVGVAQERRHLPNLQIQHHCPIQACGSQSHCWRIDGEQCKLIPPHLTCDKMPREVAAVRAHMACKLLTTCKDVRHNVLHSAYHRGCPTDNQAVRRFRKNWIIANPQEYDCSAWKNAWIKGNHGQTAECGGLRMVAM